MMIDATFWVMVSFFAFLGLLIYFKIPQKVKIALDENIKNTQALILAPTHELANQILSVVKSIGSFRKGLVTQLLVGGTSVDADRQKLDSNPPHIVVGTPGRVHDMIRRKYLKTEKISIIVLDEADEMLSQGFKDQIYKIFNTFVL